MLIAVIRHGVIVSRDRHNHFVDRIDRQRAVVNNKRHFLEVIVVVRELVSFQTHLVGTRVSALRFRGASKREVAFLVQLVVDRHVVARNRMLRAVIRHGVIVSRNRHNHFVDRIDRQRSRIRRRNDILSCRVNLVQRITRFVFILFKLCPICSDIRSRCARFGNADKGNPVRRTGKAGNAMLVSIISRRVAVRRQLDVLIIVEIDYVFVRVSLNRDLLGISRYRRVAIDRNGGFRHGTTERRSSFFRRCNFSRCSVQIIVYRVIGGVLFIVERQLALVFCEIDGLLFRVTIYKIERIEIFLPGIRRCDLFGGLPHKA